MPKTTMPKRATGVHTRAGSHVWQWRIKTPKDLRHLYASEWAYRCSLGTSSLRDANSKAARLYSDWLAKFDKQRQPTAAQITTFPAQELSPEWIEYMSEKLLHDTLAIDEHMRSPGGLAELAVFGGPTASLVQGLGPLDGMPEAAATQFAKNNLEKLAEVRLQMSRRDVKPLFEWLRSLGAAFDETTPGIREFLDIYLKAAVQAAEMKVRRDRGEFVETPPAPLEGSPTKAYQLRDVFVRWKASKGKTISPDAIRARERALLLYEEFTGNPPIIEITRDKGDEFLAWLLTRGGASKTASDRLIYVVSLFAYADSDLEWIPRNPWAKLRINDATETRRYPWTASQIQAFFSQPLFTSYALPQRAARAGADAAYWIPLLGLFTGARSAELCQLQTSDILQDQEYGIWVIDVNDNDDGKRLKSEASRRKVPIHSALIELGFLDYAEAVRKAGHTSLWPKLSLNPGKPSLGFSRWFNEGPRKAIPEVAIPDFHSLRHTVRSKMAEVNVSEADQDDITGHATTGSIGRRVYRHVSLPTLKTAIECIKYPSFSLNRSYPIPVT